MLVGFTRYSRDQSFAVLGQNSGFLPVMAIGSMVGTFNRRPPPWPGANLRPAANTGGGTGDVALVIVQP
jgi:hypothetical protein